MMSRTVWSLLLTFWHMLSYGPPKIEQSLPLRVWIDDVRQLMVTDLIESSSLSV